MKRKSGEPGAPVVSGSAGYEQAGVVELVATGWALIALLGGLGVLCLAIIGRWWLVFDIAAHLTLHAIGAFAGGLLALLLIRKSRPGLAIASLPFSIVATLAVPVAFAQSATWSVAGGTTSPADGRVRIVSLNIWHSNRDQRATVSFLNDIQADIVFLTEFGPTRRAWLGRLKERFPYQVGCAETYHCAVQLLSRHPIKSFRSLSRDRGTGPPSVHVTFGPELEGLHVIGVHLMRPIDSYTGSDREVRQIAKLARQRGDQSVVVIGDFNLTGWSNGFATFVGESGLKHMGAFMPTWPAGPRGRPQLAIDHAFASQEIVFDAVGLGPAVGSDHRPIIVDLVLPKGGT